jgi:uncharacterized repeat protein (TIGR01451 family)
VVLSLLLAPVVVIENEGCVQEYEQHTPVQISCSENSKSSPPISLALPSIIKIWEAWAKGYANISQTISATYTVKNKGPVNIIIDEYVMLLSPSPANPSEDLPGYDDETQDGVLTTTYTISPGYSFVYNYGDYLNPPLWWCTEETEWVNSGVPITLGGEILPYDMIQIVKNPNEFTQETLYYYMNNNPTLIIGKRPLWKEIANIGDVVDITLEITNIGFLDANYVVVTDTIPSNYSYDPTSFTKTPSSITNNPDGSTTLKWKIAKIQAGVKTPPNEPTIYSTEYIGYKLITPILDPDKRIFLPRAYVDKNDDDTNDAESEEPLLETLLVNQPPVAVVGDVQISEGDTAYLDGSSSYDPDEPSGDYIVSYEWDVDGDGNPDNYGSMVNLTYGDDGIYMVTLTVTDTYGLSSSTTANITVINVAPTIGLMNDVEVNEGQKATINAHVTDPGSDDLTLTWQFELGPTFTNVFYNDGVGPDPYPSPGGTYPFSCDDVVEHTYYDNGEFPVTLDVVDDDGNSTTYTVNVSVNNVAPTVTLMIPPSSDEGLPINFLAEATDPGSDDLTFTWQFEYGPTITHIFYNDGVGPDPYPSPWGTYPFNVSDTVTHTYGDNYNYTLNLLVTDDDGGIFTYTSTFTVNNVAPSIIEVAIPITLVEGSPSTFLAKAKDFGSDDLTFEWDFGDWTSIVTNTFYNDGANPDPYPSPNGTFPFIASDTINHVYGDNYDNYIFSLKVTDDDNGMITFTTNLTVHNVPPIIEMFGPFEIDEGSPLTLAANSTDQGSDDLTFEWEFELGSTITNIYYNDGVSQDPTPSPWGIFPFTITDSVVHTYGDDYEYNLILTVTDDDGGMTTFTTTIKVKNVVPTIEPFGPFTVDEGSPLTLATNSTDPGSDDLTFSWQFEFGPTITNTYYNDGANPDPYPSPWGTFPFITPDSVAHTYGDDYEYNLTLTVTDDDNGMTTFITAIIVENVVPTIEPFGPFTVDEGSPLTLATNSTDPGSDDLIFEWEFELGPTISNTYYNDDVAPDPKPSPWGIFPFSAFGSVIHTYGDNHAYNLTLTVTDDDGDADVYTTTITVDNVAPTVDLDDDHIIDENSPITLNGHGTDPGSDDLKFTWEIDFGPTITSIYFNDGVGPDPYPSPEINSIDVIDAVTHIYGDNGVFNVTLTVEDDDGGKAVETTEVIVENLAPNILKMEAYMYANISLRIAGEKWHSVGIYLYEDGSEIGFAKVTRQPGNPDEQIGTISYVKIDMTKSYKALVDYLPNDPRVNGNVWGGNPVWIDMEFEDGTSKRLHHTFNVRQSDWNSDHWNHIDPWEVEFNPHLVGHNITFEAEASDPGSDDLTFNWDLGDGNSIMANIYYNNGLNPDPYPSPEINPMCCTDTVKYIYGSCGVFCITLTVEDDDGGNCICSITLNVG